MKLIDTHCHLCHARLRPQVDAVLDRARQAGVLAVICAAGNLDESQAAMDLAGREVDVYFMAGVHPHDAEAAPAGYLQHIRNLTGEAKNVAIGEIGLDYHYNYSPPEDQRRIFGEQLQLAKRLEKRIIIHTREAFDDTLGMLIESGASGRDVVFHSCTESPSDVRRILDFGAMVSFSGIVTFSKADSLREAAGIVPRDRLLIETDSPFLCPAPIRKVKTNEPANVVHIAACLAELYRLSDEALAEQTTANAARFFGLDVGF